MKVTLEILARCWICVNQYEEEICPLYKLLPEWRTMDTISDRQLAEVIKLAEDCVWFKYPETPEEKLKVL